MRRLNLDTLDALAQDERKYNPRKGDRRLNGKQIKRMSIYKGHDRSVTIGGVINPPTKNAAKSAFAAQAPRLNTATVVESRGNVVKVPGIYG
jgi:hypothetical protein